LANPDVFYFGNAAGETGNQTTVAAVTVADVARIRQKSGSSGLPITNLFDINRDGSVTVADVGFCQQNSGFNLYWLSAPAPLAQRDLLEDSRALSALANTTVTSLDERRLELPWLPATGGAALSVQSTSTPLARETTRPPQRSNARQLDVVQACVLDATSQRQVGRLDDPDHRAALARRIRWTSGGRADDELRARDQAFTELLTEWEQF
jgi:hypothetical protein